MIPVLALHPMLASGAIWRGVAARLDRPLIAPDLPGHGRAPEATGDYFAAAVTTAREALPDGPVHLLGHSFGGVVALALLAGGVRPASVTLVEPVLFAAAGPVLRDAHRAEMAPFDIALRDGEPEAAARHFHGLWGEGTWDDLPPRTRAGLAAGTHRIAATAGALMDDTAGILDGLPVDPPPVMIVTRASPPPLVAGIADGLADRLPRARVARLGRGHMLPLTDPEALAGALTTFWGG